MRALCLSISSSLIWSPWQYTVHSTSYVTRRLRRPFNPVSFSVPGPNVHPSAPDFQIPSIYFLPSGVRNHIRHPYEVTHNLIQYMKTIGYGLDDRSSIPGTGNDGAFSLRYRARIGDETHPAPYSIGSGGSFPGGKAAGAWSWPLNTTSTEMRMRGAIPPLPQQVFIAWWLITEEKVVEAWCLFSPLINFLVNVIMICHCRSKYLTSVTFWRDLLAVVKSQISLLPRNKTSFLV
jgi:hypothetical protein